MSQPVLVQIIGMPIACAESVKDSWHEVKRWAAVWWKDRIGDFVQVKYYNLYDADCPLMPDRAQSPLVMLTSSRLGNGSRLSRRTVLVVRPQPKET